MGNENMAKLISELRKSKGMTQKQLAEKLNVTDKSVSKWERGMGYPDITILSSLAETLGVTANELLNGKKSSPLDLTTTASVETTLQYANQVNNDKKEATKHIVKTALTLFFLLGILVCSICDLAISKTFTWSWYPMASIIFAWLVIMPLFQLKKNALRASLISLSIFVIPFLIVLGRVINNIKSILSLGIPIALIGIAYMWSVFFLFMIKKLGMWNAGAFSILLAIPVAWLTNYIVAKFASQPIIDVWDILAYGILAAASTVLFFMGWKSNNCRN